ncbi:glycine betaine ABC transporter substrate-binding protein [Actinacidiphila oryziradicis]|uniref:glycine betaine ABC transporter substrate-binding protein n=1 Tax=Actinacidiphila oryziradicis TaxID=2571141 RepID=UPI0023F4CB8A|nr:glycine betaine ABC transporter substrate-binding protein [Actinacidiphila oryziradicis]
MAKWPAVAGLLNPISKKLTTQVARELSGQVDVEGDDPHEVAKRWLIQQGSIKNPGNQALSGGRPPATPP